MKQTIWTLLLIFVFCTSAFAESSVWKAQKGKVVLYLGGTCHVLRESDYPLPAEFEKAYRASDMVVFETDLGKLQDPSMQQQALSKAMYSDGTTIQDHLSPKTYRELKAYCDANGIPLAALSQMKPSMLMVTLTLMELMKLGVTQQGVDKYYYEMALKDHKPVDGLETTGEQMDYLISMADGNEDQFVTYSLEDMKNIREKYQNLASAWRKGDTGQLDQLMITEMKSRQPQLYKRLITDRNKNWLRQVSQYEKTPKTRFLLVGVGHLVGPDGLVEALRKKGYKVDKL